MCKLCLKLNDINPEAYIGDVLSRIADHPNDRIEDLDVRLEAKRLRLEAEFAARNYRYMKPTVEVAEWGGRIMEAIDPFGNRLTFNEIRSEESRA